MYYIAICDDEQTELHKTNALLSRYRETHSGCDFTVESFSSFHALYDKIKSGVLFDLLFLDIYMPDKTGIEVARELRKWNLECQIVFLTTSKEHAVETFDVDAAQYLIKPVMQKCFFTVLYKVLGRLSGERRGYLVLRAEGEVRRLPVRSIIYSESQNQYQRLYFTDNEKMQVRMTVAEFFLGFIAFCILFHFTLYPVSFALVLTVLLAIATTLSLSVYDIPETLFLFLLYAQAFITAMTLSAFISQRFFGGSSSSVLYQR